MSRHSNVNVLVHMVWTTQLRRAALRPDFDVALGAMLFDKAAEIGCPLLGSGIASDHVHVVIRLERSVTLATLAQGLKGSTAHRTNSRHDWSTPLHWQAGYWAESVSPSDLDPLLRYLRRQRSHHDESHPAELWQFADP